MPKDTVTIKEVDTTRLLKQPVIRSIFDACEKISQEQPARYASQASIETGRELTAIDLLIQYAPQLRCAQIELSRFSIRNKDDGTLAKAITVLDEFCDLAEKATEDC